MDRVTFIVSTSGQRISCLLNPERLVQRRVAGLRRPWAGSGPVSGALLTDDVLLHTGGGRTEVEVDLLFDTELVSSGPGLTSRPDATRVGEEASETAHGQRSLPDVRQLTRPLWDLAENRTDAEGPRVDTVRMVWGKTVSFLAVVVAVAERLERFDASGTPSRSFLRLRLRRVTDPNPPAVDPDPSTVPSGAELAELAQTAPVRDVHVALGAGLDEEGNQVGGERLDELASRFYPGRPWLWRLIAEANGLDDAPWAPAGVALVIPEAPAQVTP